MLRRILSFAAAAAVLVTLVYREETRGTFLPIEESYLELLMTSSGREPPAPDITFLPVTDDARRAGNPIYSTWPPAPMDYALLLQSLARYTPGSVAVSAEFSWDEPDPLSVPILKERISAFPSLLLAIDLEGGSPPPVAAPLPPQTIGIIPAKNIGGVSSVACLLTPTSPGYLTPASPVLIMSASPTKKSFSKTPPPNRTGSCASRCSPGQTGVFYPPSRSL